ncbi:MAG: MAPEG family protein [Alteromonadaceae bacterium]|nr:MAPEG family protein [Alteromonadaceae bacterium]
MEVILISLFIAALMPLLAKAPLAYAMFKEGRYDNRNPREQQDRLSGFGARAKAAHYNCFEALALYTPGALAVVAVNAATDLMQYYAIAFVFARLCYLFMYWFDIDKLRSLFWIVGCVISFLMLWHAMSVAAQM